MNRILAWLEMFGLFALLYVGIPYAGLWIDRILGLSPLPIFVRGLGLILLSVGVAILAWCFALFSRVGRGTPNPAMPPESLVTIGPYQWTRNPIALGHATALIGLSLFLGSVFAAVIVVVLAFPVHRDAVALRLGEVTELRSHRGVPFVDQDPLRRRKLPRELLDEGRLVSIETLQFRLDPLLAREEAPDRRCEEANSLAERHVSPDATEDRPGVLVDQRDLAPDFLGRARGRDHLVADSDAVLTRDPNLKLGEEGERGKTAGSGGPAEEGIVPNRVQLQGNDLGPTGEDLGPDRSADVEHVADAEEGDHPD